MTDINHGDCLSGPISKMYVDITGIVGKALVQPYLFAQGVLRLHVTGFRIRRLALTMKNGTVLRFAYQAHGNPVHLASITDRYGNIVTVNRDSSGWATSILSPHGRSISFTYDSYNHIIKAANNGGQTVNYAYDGFGRLVAVADANADTANPTTSECS